MARRIGYTVRRLSSGRFQVLVRAEDGKQVGLGTWTKKADAERAGLEAYALLQRRDWIDPRKSDVPLTLIMNEWRARKAATGEHRDKYAEDAARMQRLHIDPTIGRVLITDLNEQHVTRWHAELRQKQIERLGAPGLVPAKCYRLLRACLEDARRQRYIARNPCDIPGAAAERSPERPLVTPEQVAELAATIQPRWSALILTAAWAGLRFGEAQRLERQDVDLLHGTIRVLQAKTDAGVRTIHLPRQLVAVLDRHMSTFTMPDPGAPVFVGEKGGRLDKNFIRRSDARIPEDQRKRRRQRPPGPPSTFRDAADAIGLTTLTFHDLRHFSGTQTAISGATLREIQARLGHASPAAAMRYQHAAERRGREVADAMGAGWVEPTTTPTTVRKIRRA